MLLREKEQECKETKKKKQRLGKVRKWEGKLQQQGSARKMLGIAVPGAVIASKTRTQKTQC